jgi:hypothetical protein
MKLEAVSWENALPISQTLTSVLPDDKFWLAVADNGVASGDPGYLKRVESHKVQRLRPTGAKSPSCLSPKF